MRSREEILKEQYKWSKVAVGQEAMMTTTLPFILETLLDIRELLLAKHLPREEMCSCPKKAGLTLHTYECVFKKP